MNKVKIKCDKCSSVNLVEFSEIQLRVDKNKKLCWKCCKKKRWPDRICQKCSECLMCSGKFLNTMKQNLEITRGM